MHETLIFLAPIVGLVFVLIIQRPYIGVACVLLLLIPLAASQEGVSIYGYAISGIFAITILSGFVHKLSKRNKYPKKIILGLIFLETILIFLCTYGYLRNGNLVLVIKDAFPFYFTLIVIPILAAHTEKQLNVIAGTIVMVTVAVSAWCVVLTVKNGYIFNNPFAGESGYPYNTYVYAIGLPFVYGHFLYSDEKWLKSILLVSIGVILWRVSIGFKRQPFMIAIVTLIGLPLLKRFYKRHNYVSRLYLGRVVRYSFITVGMAGVVALVPSLFRNYLDRFSPTSLVMGLLTRFAQYTDSFNTFVESPFAGKGFGYNETIIAPITIDKSISFVNKVELYHGLYPYLISHTGLLGLVAITLVLSYSLILGGRLLSKKEVMNRVGGHVLASYGVIIAFIMITPFSVKSTSLEGWALYCVCLSILINIDHRYG